MTLLQRRALERSKRRRETWQATREGLRRELRTLIPGMSVYLFGSIVKGERFHESSDIDLALWEEPDTISRFGLVGELEERLGRSVDVVLLGECRFREKILREGEKWTLSN